MDAVTKLAVSIYLRKQAETHIQKGQKAKVKTWDKIKGVAEPQGNTNTTNPDNPNPKDIPCDTFTNNKQVISGSGPGPIMS